MGLFWTPHAWFELLEWRMVSNENNLLLRWALLQPSRLLERVRGLLGVWLFFLSAHLIACLLVARSKALREDALALRFLRASL